MFRSFDIRIVLFLTLGGLYWAAITSVNSAVADCVYLSLPAVFIVPVALFSGWKTATFVVAFCALAASAGRGQNMFAVCAVWLAAAFLLNSWRFKLRFADAFSSAVVFAAVNLAVVCLCAVFSPADSSGFWQYLRRLGCDAAASSLVAAAVSRLCMTVPAAVMEFFGVDIYADS